MGGNDKYGSLPGVVMIGFGSIGRGTLPLIERHFEIDRDDIVVVAPDSVNDKLLLDRGIRKVTAGLTPSNYLDVLTPLLQPRRAVRTRGGEPGAPFCVNVSVDTSSVDILRLCRRLGALYVDTVIEPWPGFYDNPDMALAARTNYSLRQTLLAERAGSPGGPTAVSACGANPGMVSWFVKQALLDVAGKLGMKAAEPNSRREWAQLMRNVGVKGIHIAERDTQRAALSKTAGTFVNTWSVDGFISEGLQPAELGWGTHERWWPASARRHEDPAAPSIYLAQPGADTRVRTWCPTFGPQYGLCVTHNEAISIADYFTVHEQDIAVYRPTCHYAYHPADDALLSWHELLGGGGHHQLQQHVLSEDEIVDGIDELGVLLYGHAANAYWYGSRLSMQETRRLAPYQNATGLQVSSAVLAAMVWALEHPQAGIVEAEDMDFRRCLEIQRPYLGPVEGHYTRWTPLSSRSTLFPDDIDEEDPWQFRNVMVH
ncbi:MAG TPA: saccharopine dehydrogenase C-terminal domain-containing protein [Acidimicrobiales bacterium]|nr:saccharopine dehydrogenase C-terminal domain-containing protein [Acidimicrobiales bacterium]